MNAIFTKFLPATHTKGSRIKAFCPGHPNKPSFQIGYHADCIPSNESPDDYAVKQLCFKMGWNFAKLVKGGFPGGTVWVFGNQK